VLALRPWELDEFNKLRRKRKPQTAGRGVTLISRAC
jgi:hypothetical protein